MSPYLLNLIRFTVLASLTAAALLTAAKRVAPERTEITRRFGYFFVRCLVTVGFWALILWIVWPDSTTSGGLP